MSTSEKRKVWMVIDHPNQLATALSLVPHWGREKFAFHLIIARHPYWRKVDISRYKQNFDKVITVNRPDYVLNPFPDPRKIFKILRQQREIAQLKGQAPETAVGRSIFHRLQTILLYPIRVCGMITQIWRVKKIVARLKIQASDIIISLAIGQYVENIVLSTCPESLKIGIIDSALVYEVCISPIKSTIFKKTLESQVANWLVEPITGLHRTLCVSESPHPLKGWIRYKNSLLEIYDKVIALDNPPDKVEEDIYTMPSPYILALNNEESNHSNNRRKKVVFFGCDFLGPTSRIIPPELYARRVNDYLSFIREKYGSTCKLVYRPHPRETHDRKFLDLNHFEIEDDGMMTELYLHQNYEDIHAVFTVDSSSARSAYHFFINAYSFLNISPYDDLTKNNFKSAMGNVPDDFYINDLSAIPASYINTEEIISAREKCRTVLDAVIR